MKRWMALAAGCALLWAGGAAAAPVKTTFTLVGDTFNVTLPADYCLPGQTGQALADTIAAADQQNQTDITFFECAALKPGVVLQRYGMIKTPKATLTAAMPPRADLLKQFKTMLDNGTMAQTMNKVDMAGTANKAVKETTGVDLKLQGQPRVVEVDDTAAYMIGPMSAEVNGERKEIVFACAITMVKGRMMGWYRYAPHASEAEVAEMMNGVKADIRRFIADNGG